MTTTLFTKKPFIIAEVGSNFESFNDAMQSVQMAKVCGADAVKFQMFDDKALYGHELLSWNKAASLPHEWLKNLREKANACGIEFMCSPFSVGFARAINPYVAVHKVASSELSHVDMLRYIASTGKPVVLSCGASSLTDIALALKILDPSKTVLLYCVAAYPSSNVNLYGIDKLRETFPQVAGVGYSCHTYYYYTPVAAWDRHGAVVLEKHFKLRDMNTPDNSHALEPEAFKEMVDIISGKIDKYPPFPEPQEEDMLLRHNRRLIVTQPIAKGMQFIAGEGGNFGAYRSLKDDPEALTPFVQDKIAGKLAAREHKVGDPVTPTSFEG